MILFYKDNKIEENHIHMKKELYYSEDFSFIPIHYQKKELLIQTPNVFIPYGIQKYKETDKKEYMSISFQDFSSNQVSKDFVNNFMIPIYEKILEKCNDKYHLEPFLKLGQYSSHWMRCKLTETTTFYNQHKEKINLFPSKVFGSFILQLSGLWIIGKEAWFQWTILQGKIYEPIVLKDYAFIDDIPKKIPPAPPPPPPPPPPPNKYKKMLTMGIPKAAVQQKQRMDSISAKDLQSVCLKKCQPNQNKTKQKDSFKPSLDEIKNALQSLKKKKC